MIKRVFVQNKKFLVALTFLFCVILSVCMTVFMSPPVANAASNEIGNFSFVLSAQAAAQFLGHSQDPMYGASLPDTGLVTKKNGNLLNEKKYKYGNAGGLLGYLDGFEDDSAMTVAGMNTRNTVEYYYRTLATNIRVDKLDSTEHFVFAGYGYYGYALSALGFDETTTGSSKGLRPVVGGLILAMYVLSTLVGSIFNFVIKALQWLNPWRLLLYTGAEGGSASEAYLAGQNFFRSDGGSILTNRVAPGQVDSWETALQFGVQSLQKWLATFYNILANNALVIIALCIALSLFTWLLVKQGREFGKTFKNLLIRVAFILIGVPLMFTTYSAVLTRLGEATETSNSISSNIVFSTFVDFEKWVYTNRLNPGSNTGTAYFTAALGDDSRDSRFPIVVLVDPNDYTASLAGESVAEIREMAHYYNQNLYGEGVVSAIHLISSGDVRNNAVDAQLDEMYKFDYTMASKNNREEMTNTTYQTALSMLSRYMNGTTVSGASYESYIVSSILRMATSDDDGKLAEFQGNKEVQDAVWEFALVDNWRNFHSKEASAFPRVDGQGGGNGFVVEDMSDEEMQKAASVRFSGDSDNVTTDILWGSGILSLTSNPPSSGPDDENDENGGKIKITFVGNSKDTDVLTFMGRWITRLFGGDAAFDGFQSHDGLSAMAMYNYLNSSFDESKITVYSSGTTATDQVQIGHYSVNAVGSTVLTRIIYLLDAMVLMGSTVIIGIGYAFGILFANFKAIFKVIPAVLGGMFGSLRGIASSLALLVAMIVELLVSVALYLFATKILYSIYDIIERPLALLLKTHSGDVFYNFAPVALGLISLITVIWLTFKLLQWRVQICRAVSEACSGVVGKIVGVDKLDTDLHGKMSAGQMLAGAATAVVGARALGVDVEGLKQEASDRISDIRGAFNGGDGKSIADAEGKIVGGTTMQSGMTNQFGVRGSNGATSTGLLSASAAAVGTKLYGNSSSNAGDRIGTPSTENGKSGQLHGENAPDRVANGDVSKADSKNGAVSGAVNSAKSEMTADMKSTAEVAGHEDVSGEITENGTVDMKDSGTGLVTSGPQSADTVAEQYVERNKEMFLASVNAAREAQQPQIAKAKEQDIARRREYYAAYGNPNDANSFVITDANGTQTQGLSIVRADNGEAYTLADKMEGAEFNVQDSEGNVYVDSAGTTYNNMSSEDIAISSTREGEKISAIRTADGNRAAVMSQADVGKVEVTDSMGVKAQNLRVINPDTGNVYTMADKRAGSNFSVVNQDGSVYVDSAGNNYENVSSNMIEMDKTTGMVTRFGAADENGQIHVNQVYDANQTVYGYSSVMTSQASNNIIHGAGENTPLVVPSQSGGGNTYQTYNEAVEQSTPNVQVTADGTQGVAMVEAGIARVDVPQGGQPGNMNVYQDGGSVQQYAEYRGGDMYEQAGAVQPMPAQAGSSGGYQRVGDVVQNVTQYGGDQRVIQQFDQKAGNVTQYGGDHMVNQQFDQRAGDVVQQMRSGDQNMAATYVGGAQNIQQNASYGGMSKSVHVDGGQQSVNVQGGSPRVGTVGAGGQTVIVPVPVGGMNARPVPAPVAPAAPGAPVVNNAYYTQKGSTYVQQNSQVHNQGGDQHTTIMGSEPSGQSSMDRAPGGAQRMPQMPQMPAMPNSPAAGRTYAPPSNPNYVPQAMSGMDRSRPNAGYTPPMPSGGQKTVMREMTHDRTEMRQNTFQRDTFQRDTRTEMQRDTFQRDTYRDVSGAVPVGNVGRDTYREIQGNPVVVQSQPGQVRTEVREKNNSFVNNQSTIYHEQKANHVTTEHHEQKTDRVITEHHYGGSSGDFGGGSANPGRRPKSDAGHDVGSNPFDR